MIRYACECVCISLSLTITPPCLFTNIERHATVNLRFFDDEDAPTDGVNFLTWHTRNREISFEYKLVNVKFMGHKIFESIKDLL